MNRVEAREEYLRAWKRAQKDYREKMAAGQYPYLPVLDDILQSANVESQLPIGTVEVPLELLVGTKTAGRTAAFASNFMPLLEPDTEFASKWISLCQAHVEEGIRDPIRCFEYLGRFYVQEGNKRVSVLKYFEADSISATVTRVMPQYSDNKEIRLYYEFVEYYPLCGLYTLTFTQEGSFARLQKALGKAPGEKWSDDDRADIVSLYNWIKKSYHARGGENMRTTVGDVLLLLIRVYTLADLKKRSPAELTKALDAIWDDVLAIEQPVPVKLSTKPAEPDQVKLIDRILPAAIRPGAAPKNLQVAFVHERTPETSTWTSQHEFGRSQLDQVFPGQVKTKAYYNAVSGENADELVEQAIAEGADIVFTTSPKLVGASLRAALKHPDIRILNCSVDMPYTGIRTYYTRVYEAKFISGAIAGAMSSGDRIGYVADYPTSARRPTSTPLRWARAWSTRACASTCSGPACRTPTRSRPLWTRASRSCPGAIPRHPATRSGSSVSSASAAAACSRTSPRRSGIGASSMKTWCAACSTAPGARTPKAARAAPSTTGGA